MKAFAASGITFYGGGRTRDGGWQEWPEDGPVDLAIGPHSEVRVRTRSPQGWLCSRYLPTIIELDWPDMSIPKVPPAFWSALVTDIKARGIKSVQAQCMGGHGRTGTALAIFLALMRPEHYDSVDMLVKDLRMLYCENAVEKTSQFEYIAAATGLPYHGRIGPSKHYGSAGSSYGYQPQQTLFQPTGADADAFGAESYPESWDELYDHNLRETEDLIETTSSADLLVLADAHAADLGCTLEHVNENGFDFYVLIDDQTGEVEEFDTVEDVADYLQLDSLYSY